MGIFDLFNELGNEAKEITEKTKLQALSFGNPKYAFQQIGCIRGFTVRDAAHAAGYFQALQVLLRNTDDYELRAYYNEAYQNANIKQLTALKATMEERGYEVKDEDGNWVPPDRI